MQERTKIRVRKVIVGSKNAHKRVVYNVTAMRNEKGKIDAWHESGETITAIANRLHRTYNCISNYLKRKIVARNAGSGRPRKTTTRQDRTILINAKRNCRKNAQEIADELKAVDGGADVSRRTLTQRINEAWLR